MQSTPSSRTISLPSILAMALIVGTGCFADTEGALGSGKSVKDIDFNTPVEDVVEDIEDVMEEEVIEDVAPDVPEVVEASSCASAEDCPAPEICLIVLDDPEEPLICGPAVGDGQVGDPCTADEECASGLCFEGLCTAPCGEDADCPEGFACEERMVSDTLSLDICVPDLPDPCAALDDCAAPEYCRAERGETDLTFSCLDDGGATGELGEPCTEDDACRSNLCERNRCTAPCGDAADCATGTAPMTCLEQEVALGGDVTTTAMLCVGPMECSADDVCPDQLCVFERGDDILLQSCGDGNDPGGDPGFLCDEDADCANNLCLSNNCVSACSEDEDCPEGLSCLTRIVTLDGQNVEVSVCAYPPEDACVSDGDCDGDDICAAHRRGDRVDFFCDTGNPGGGGAGESCTEDAGCLANLCEDDVCVPPCGTDNHCDADNGEFCGTVSVEVEAGSVTIDGCTFPEPCQAEDQCDDDVTCYVQFLADDRVETVCQPPNDNGQPPGTGCTDNSECAANLCHDEWLETVCAVPCEASEDCPTDYTCVERELVDGVASSATSICVPPDPDPCQATSDCADQQVCTVVLNRDGDGLESVCVDPVGAGNNETMCGEDAECRADICLTGSCSSLCRDRVSDCGPNQVCEPLDITRGDQTDMFNLCRTLPDTACGANEECADGNRVCGHIRLNEEPTQPYCIWPEVDGAAIGTACTGTRSPSDECFDRICLTPFTNECTTTCVDNQDCADASAPTGFVCTDFRIAGDPVRMCAEGCTNDTGCDDREDHLCGLSRNVTDDRFEFVCRSNMGDDPSGTDCSETINCDHGICLIRRNGGDVIEQICTQPCETDPDCPQGANPPWVCGDATIGRPGTGDPQTLRVCTRN